MFTAVRGYFHHGYKCEETSQQEESAHIYVEHVGEMTVGHPLYSGVDVEDLINNAIIRPRPALSTKEEIEGLGPIGQFSIQRFEQ